jgi:hypothetical protein
VFNQCDLLWSGANIEVSLHLLGRCHRWRHTRGHIRDCGSVSDRQIVETIAKKFNKLTNNAVFSKHFYNGQDQICRSGCLEQVSGQFEAYGLRHQQRNGLAQHRRFRFYSTNAPTVQAKAINHSGVRVGANQRVRIQQTATISLPFENNVRKVLQVDLMNNTSSQWHN